MVAIILSSTFEKLHLSYHRSVKCSIHSFPYSGVLIVSVGSTVISVIDFNSFKYDFLYGSENSQSTLCNVPASKAGMSIYFKCSKASDYHAC